MAVSGGYISVYISSSSFSVSGDLTDVFNPNRRVRLNCDQDGMKYGSVLSSSYVSPDTIVTLKSGSDEITENLCTCKVALQSSGSDGTEPDHVHSSLGEGGDTISDTNLINSLHLGNGSTASGTLTLSLAPTYGDCFIASGKTDFTNDDSGFILGIDDSDSDKTKLYLGDSTNYLNWDGTDLILSGQINAGSGSIGGWTISSTTLANGTDIILDSSNKSISINDATYGNQGIQLQYNSGTPRFHAGNGTTKFFKFDGTDVSMSSGDILACALLDSLTLGSASNNGILTLTTGIGLGDSYINCGKTAFDNTQSGFILGLEDDSNETAKFYIGNTTDYLNWTGSNFVLNVSSSDAIVINSGGDIKLEADTSDPGQIVFSGTDYNITLGTWTASGSAFWVLPDTDEVCSFFIGENKYSSPLRWFEEIYLHAKTGVTMYARHNADNFSHIRLYNNDTTTSQINLEVSIGGFDYELHYHMDNSGALYFSPDAHKAVDLGLNATAWDDAYADDWNNVADFYHLDSKDDLKAILNIKGSGVFDQRTGLEIIDDSTLPKWLLSRDKRTKEILYDPDNKPYISLKTGISLSWGAIRQLNNKIDNLENRIKYLEGL